MTGYFFLSKNKSIILETILYVFLSKRDKYIFMRNRKTIISDSDIMSSVMDVIDHVSMCGSVFMMVALTLERHFAICSPHAYRYCYKTRHSFMLSDATRGF